MNKNILLAIVLVLVVGSISWLQFLKPKVPSSDVAAEPIVAPVAPEPEKIMPAAEEKKPATTAVAATSKYLTPAQKAKKYEPGIELAGITGYLNLPAGQNSITLKELVGKKVIMVDFWTYSCINCQRTLPYLTDWYKKYKDQGFEIIGVHTPEFAFEKETANVQSANAKYGITYPVVQDNNYATWTAYNNHYWPHHYLIDIDGYMVEDHIGEGAYDTTEKKIQELLAERAYRLGMKVDMPKDLSKPAVEAAPTYAVSPETYFGSSRNEYLGTLLKLSGAWSIQSEHAASVGEATISYIYQGQRVYFVAHAATPITVEVLRDGKPLSKDQAGEDIFISTDGKSWATIGEARLYKLIKELPNEPAHQLEIRIPKAGLEAFTFTFG